MEMTKELIDDGATLSIAVGERFDYTKVQAFRQAYETLPDNVKHVRVNLGMTEYVDSSALGMLLTMHKVLNDRQISMSLHHCQPTVLKVFNIARFEKMFNFT